MFLQLKDNPREVYRRWGLEMFGEIGQAVMRDTDLTPDNLLNPYGCVGLFDPCGDNDWISMAMCGSDPLMDVLGWQSADYCRVIKKYLTWVGPNNAIGAIPGTITPNNIIDDCCEDRPSVAWGTCEWEMEDFGHIGNSGGAVCLYDDINQLENMCDQFLLDGTPITNNLQFRDVMASQVILQTLRWMIKNGDATTDGHFDGLDRIVTTGVTDRQGNPCPELDSIVIDWNSGCYAGAASTWTDARGTVPLTEGYSIIDLIWLLYRHTNRRRTMSPMLNSQPVALGDVFIAGHSDLIECLRQCNVCHTMCSGDAADVIQVVINQRESREYYEQLVTGPGDRFGFGYLSHRGVNIPYIESDNLGDDLYLLWRRAGNVPLLWGEYQDTRALPLDRIPGNHFRSSDGGRFLHYTQTDNTCVQEVSDFRPRLRYDGRWMQSRIIGFDCDLPRTVPQCNPLLPNFYIPGPLGAATQ